MKRNIKNNVEFLTFNSFDKIDFIKHGFSTKHGGVSTGHLESMNLSFKQNDSEANVRENYFRICKAIDITLESLVFSAQEHNTVIQKVDAQHRGRGFTKPLNCSNIDGMITNTNDLTLVTHYADCVPLYFVDMKKKAIGLSHAGWRGTVGEIGPKTITAMKNEFDSNPEDIIVGIGPAIGKCCFEVDQNCYAAFLKLDKINLTECMIEKSNHKYMIDLIKINQNLLIKAGIPSQNITAANICTCCHHDYLYSHRAAKGQCGRSAAFLSLR